MKREIPGDFHASEFFCLRTPLLPFDEFVGWGTDLASATVASEDLAVAVTEDRARLCERLRSQYSRPELQEAIRLASPGLLDAMHEWIAEPGRENTKIERALTSYFARMSGRATPFGLFAGISIGSIVEGADRTALIVATRESTRRHARLDNEYLYRVARGLIARRADLDWPRWTVSSSLYVVGGRIRYVERGDAGEGFAHSLAEVERSRYLDVVLASAARASTTRELVAALIQLDDELEHEAAKGFVDELIGAGILVSEMVPPLTGSEPLDFLVANLVTVPQVAEEHAVLRGLQAELRELGTRALGDASDVYERLWQSLESLPAQRDSRRFVQVDLVRQSPDLAIGANVVDELRNALEILHLLTPAITSPILDRFRTKFEDRYGDRELPLAEVLDTDQGIDIDLVGQTAGSSLLQAIPIPRGRPADDEKQEWGVRWMYLLRQIEKITRSGGTELRLEELDLEILKPRRAIPLPDAITMMATIAAASEADVEAGRFQLVVEGACGPPGVDVLGRFCHADATLTTALRGYLRSEEANRPDCVYAEIVHLPEDRAANIAARPLLRGYEIPYVASSGAPLDRQISISDLMVSVREGRIILRSRRLGREVVPRMTAAHNFRSRGLALYKFLCLLQQQDLSGRLSWNWGPISGQKQLPRVTHGRTILALAQWRLGPEELRTISQESGAALFATVQSVRRELGMPRYVGLVEGDNVLPIDLENVISLEVFSHWCKPRAFARLLEIYPAPAQLLARGNDGRYVHELFVPFARRATTAAIRSDDRVAVRALPATRRLFPPGSEWLTLKIYAGRAALDRLLCDTLRHIIKRGCAAGLIDTWFFVRYSDPDWHLRLRLHGDPAVINGEVAASLHESLKAFLDEGTVWRVQHDTYDRETERYGGPTGVELAEEIFHADSECVLDVLEVIRDQAADVRWWSILLGIDRLLRDLGLDPAEKHRVVADQYLQFSSEFGITAPFEHELGRRYRPVRRLVETLCADHAEDARIPTSIFAAFAARSAATRSLVTKLDRALAADTVRVPRLQLARSLVHMFVNRLARGETKAHELILCNFLMRAYESQSARAKRGS